MSAPDPLLVQVLAEVRELRLELAALRSDLAGHGSQADPATADLLRAIESACGALPFTSSDLLAHAELPDCADLAVAIVACIGAASARKLGKLLCRIEGVDVDGLAVHRVSEGRDGIVWRVASLRV